MKKTLRLDGSRHETTVALHGATFRITDGDRSIEGMRRWDGARLQVELPGERVLEAHVVRAAGGRTAVWIDSDLHLVEEETRGGSGGRGGAEADTLVTPMPAKVVRVNVAAGDAVTEGQTLVVVESMKMELGLTAPRDGVVATVNAEVGVMVAAGSMLVALAPKEAP